MKNLQAKSQKNLIKQGDIFRLGDHAIACGDSRDKELINQLVKGTKIKAVISDVPYGINYVGSKNNFKQKIRMPKDILNDGCQTDEQYSQFTREWLQAIVPHLEKKNSIYIFNSDKMVFALRQAMEEEGITFSQLIIWIKNQAVVGRKDYLPQHELIAYGWHGSHKFLKSKDKSIIFCPKPSKSALHPTMKPVSLIRHLILNSTRVNDYIFDGFLGSGTAVIAAEQVKRKCLGVEIDAQYIQSIIDRYHRLTGVKAEKIN